MRIEAITSVEAFASLKDNWEAVYAADPEAHFFLSWTWLSKWLKELTWQWVILAAKPTADASDYIAFFPLKYRAKKTKEGATVVEIAMAGNRAADYTGFICMPAFQDHVIRGFTAFIKNKKWNSLHLENFLVSDHRLKLFLRQFPKDDFLTIQINQFDDISNVDNCICPYVKLPPDWECYLNGSLGSNTRQKVKRFLRKVDTCSDFRITHAQSDTVEKNVDILLRFWTAKWGESKGERLTRITKVVRTMLVHCFSSGSLFLPVLWKGEMPIGALASLIDKEKRSLLFFIGGRDMAVSNPPPGFILHAYSIRYAISNGFTTYDFLRGNEPYKYLFGAEERRIRHLVIRSKKEQARIGRAADAGGPSLMIRHPAPIQQVGRS